MWAQDRLYTALMRELAGSPTQWNVRRKYRDLAAKLNVDEETLRLRLHKLHDTGLLLGWRLLPNPAIMKCESALIHLQLLNTEARNSATRKLQEMDGVVIIAQIYHQSLIITIFHPPNQLQKTIKNITTTCGGKVTSWTWRLPTTPQHPERIDWQIMKQLLRDAEQKLPAVAHQLKVSPRTAKRRISNMMTNKAYFLIPIINLKKLGGVPYHLIVEYQDESKQKVDQKILQTVENLAFRSTEAKTFSIYGFTGTNINEGEEITKWIKQQPGVVSVRMNIVEGVTHAYSWLERELEAQILHFTPIFQSQNRLSTRFLRPLKPS